MGDDPPPLFGGHHFRPTASFCNRIVEYEIRDELLQSAILILERTQPLHVGDVHAVQLPRGSSAGIRADGSVRPGAFNPPDLRGGFLRGVDGSPAAGPHQPDAGSRPKPIGNTGNDGKQVGNVVDDATARGEDGSRCAWTLFSEGKRAAAPISGRR